MFKEPLVSIVINNYNYRRFLAEAIGSALEQDYRKTEVIVVDDGSTDNSREIISRYADRVTPVLKDNFGQASAFNAGFVHCRGDIIIFLDADDVLLPQTAGLVARTFVANPETAKVEYRLEVIDEQSHRTGRIKPDAHLPTRSGDMRRQVLDFPYDMTWMATSGNAFSAEILRRIFPIPEDTYGKVGADWYLSHLTPLFGPVVFLEETGAYFRVHQANNFENNSLDLPKIRLAIKYMQITGNYLKQFAGQLGLQTRPGEILSVSYIANRLVSLKLDPANHPVKNDKLWRLIIAGFKATTRRTDISIFLKAMFLVWFVLMGIAPGASARWLAEQFLFPERRGQFNRLLGAINGKRLAVLREGQ